MWPVPPALSSWCQYNHRERGEWTVTKIWVVCQKGVIEKPKIQASNIPSMVVGIKFRSSQLDGKPFTNLAILILTSLLNEYGLVGRRISRRGC